MIKINSFLKVSFMVSLVFGLMAIYEMPIDQKEFTIEEPIIVEFLIAVVTWSIVFLANYTVDKKLSFIKRKSLFHITTIISILLFSVLIMYIQNVLFKAPEKMNLTDPILINQTMYSACWITLITRCFKIAYDYLDQSRKTAIANERLLQENTKSHFALLNQQVNPHFLFNSLNTLVDLIDKENQDAISFVKEFSSVYRYVLNYGTRDRVSLAEELEFIESYLYVLNQRFQDKLLVNIDIAEKEHHRQIPPMTIQTLLENAIKHNEVSSSHPLAIDISFSGDSIIVKNKIQLRKKAPSNGLGLKNLTSRVEYLTGKKINFDNSNGHFIVTVPA